MFPRTMVRGLAALLLLQAFAACGRVRLLPGAGEECRPPEVQEETWLGCAGGCTACSDILQPYDLYFSNHPDCMRGAACGPVGQVCGTACPMPDVTTDISCAPLPTNWMGCRGSGCSVDAALIAAIAPNYIANHTGCIPTTSTEPLMPCAAACPSPTAADMFTCGGTPGQWLGCRGYGCWVCGELLRGYPLYLKNHPACTANVTCHGERYGRCNANCPAPGPADQ